MPSASLRLTTTLRCPFATLAPQDSQVALLQLAERHQQPLPFQNNDYRARLQLLAARKQTAAAEAQAGGAEQH